MSGRTAGTVSTDVPVLEHLRTASRPEATAFFADVEPEALVAEVRETADDDLLALIAREEVRPAAVEGILARLHEYAVADRLAGLHGIVRVRPRAPRDAAGAARAGLRPAARCSCAGTCRPTSRPTSC